jgi:predicted TIM-barrel fold metal-dependent hydrolase
LWLANREKYRKSIKLIYVKMQKLQIVIIHIGIRIHLINETVVFSYLQFANVYNDNIARSHIFPQNISV